MRVFIENLTAPGQCQTLGEELAHYLLHVMRVKPGQALTVFDGRGGEYPAEVLALGRKSVEISLGGHQAVERESPLPVCLLQGIARQDRMDYSLQKAVELGVTAIAPVICGRTQGHDRGRLEKRQRHWQSIIHSACEQCGRNRLPRLHPPHPLAEWLADPLEDGLLGLVLAPGAGSGFKHLAPGPSGINLLVGPEGGLSAEEIQLALQAGYVALGLGPRILRTETAGVAALAICQALWGDLGGVS